jgi:glycine betaine catabolism B
MVKKIDGLLNAITMYALLAYGLIALAMVALMFSFAGLLPVSSTGMVLSLVLLLTACYGCNTLLSRIWQVPANRESYLITALILFFILPPADTLGRGILVVIAAVLAMASKYLLAWRRAHVGNPAAFAAGVLALTGLLHSVWWVGSSMLWPLTLVFGLLVLRKIRKPHVFVVFAIVTLGYIALAAVLHHQAVWHALTLAVTASPLIFLGTVMLTEPATMPSHKTHQMIYAGLVGVLYASHLEILGVFIAPEIALLIGNVYTRVVSPKYRLRLRLKEIRWVHDRAAHFIFNPDCTPVFTAGQYAEWTLPHPRSDSRGNRRTFTIASSPTEDTIQIGVKFYEPSSTFKKALRAMRPGDIIYAGQVSGNFTLPGDPKRTLAFIAGGIGITPFRSMLQYLIDTKQQRDIILLYLVADPTEIAFRDVLDRAVAQGARVVPLHMPGKPLEASHIKKHVPDFTDRTFYLSGPNAMVESTRQLLRHMRVPANRIVTDYFSGY